MKLQIKHDIQDTMLLYAIELYLSNHMTWNKIDVIDWFKDTIQKRSSSPESFFDDHISENYIEDATFYYQKWFAGFDDHPHQS